MKITISGSMKFLETMMEQKEKFESTGCEVLLPNTKCIDMSSRQLMDEHLAKIKDSNYLLVINVDGYIGESTRTEIDYAVTQHKPIIFYEAAPDEPRSTIMFDIFDRTYQLGLPKTFILPDDFIFDNGKNIQIKGNGNITKALLLARPDIPNVNGITYAKETLEAALMSPYIAELIFRKSFGIEYGVSSDKPYDNFNYIDPVNVIGEFICISDKYLYLLKNDGFDNLPDIQDNHILVAGLRYLANIIKGGIAVGMRIVTWDVWYEPNDSIQMKHIVRMD